MIFTRRRQEQAETGEHAFPGHGRLTPEQEELRRLRCDHEILRQERDRLLVAEQKGREGRVLGRGGGVALRGEMIEEGFDLRRAHGGAVAQVVEADETFVPMEAGLLSADGVAAQADGDFLLLWVHFTFLDYITDTGGSS